MSDFQFNGVHLLIVFVVSAFAFVAGIVIGYFVRDDMINGGDA